MRIDIQREKREMLKCLYALKNVKFLPENDPVQVKRILDDPSGRDSHSKDVLNVGQIVSHGNSVNAVQITKKSTKGWRKSIPLS